MSCELLAPYMEAGFVHLRELSGLPNGIAPDFARLVRAFGDETMLEVAEPLGLREQVNFILSRAPEPDKLPREAWQQNIACWPQSKQVLSVIMGLLRACEKIEALERRRILQMEPTLMRGLAVMAYAPFVPGGDKILSSLAEVMGVPNDQPVRLIERYVMAARDSLILAEVDRRIQEDRPWWEWSERFLTAGKQLPFLPRAIGITPPLSAELKQLLVDMVMEVLDAHDSRDNRN